MAKEKVIEQREENMFTIEECYTLNQALGNLAASVPSMKGKIVFALSKNEQKLASIVKKAYKKQEEILQKYVEMDKDGNFKLTEVSEEDMKNGVRPEYVYKNEKDREKAKKELDDYFQSKVELNIHQIWKNDFDKLDIPVARNPMIGTLIEHMVSEEIDLQIVNN